MTAKKTFLVTGCAGFLATHLARHLSNLGHAVYGIGRSSSFGQSMNSHHIYQKTLDANVTTRAIKNLDVKFDAIFHLAGNASVSQSVLYPEKCFSDTVISLSEVLEYVREESPSTLIVYPSSAAVYGVQPDIPLQTSIPPSPLSPYGANKLSCETLLQSYSRNYGIKSLCIRFFSIYGPGLAKQILWDSTSKLLTQKDVIFFGTGLETRDFIYVSDAVELMYYSLTCFRGSPDKFLILNGGTGIRVTIEQLIHQYSALLGSSASISFDGLVRRGDPPHYLADVSSLIELGWRPKVTLQEGLKEYADWAANLRYK